MGILANENAIQTGGYNIANSLRFQSASSQNVNRTFGTATSRTTFTLSQWIKRGSLGVNFQFLFDGANEDYIGFTPSDTIRVLLGGFTTAIETSQVFRDPSAWYHIVFTVDSTQATASNRMKLFINGVQVTAFATTNYPALNATFNFNAATVHRLGTNAAANNYFFDGYMTEINFIDGQALTPSSFGETNTLTGQWVAKKYTGTYGTNGFYLPFSNGTSTTTLGYDSSGNSNNWTLTNFTRSAGTSDCWMNDVPSGNGSSVGGTQPNSNYCVWSPVDKSPNMVMSKSNLLATNSTAGYQSVRGTIGITSGKWYWEVKATTTIGIASQQAYLGSTNDFVPNGGYAWAYVENGNKTNAGVNTAYGATFTSADTIGIAFDADAGTLTFYKNNVSQGVAFSGLTGQTYFPFTTLLNSTPTAEANFGQRSFAYTPPSGFKALCTANLPASSIVKGNQYMDATLWTGNGSTQTITNAGGFSPDLVWTKSRSTVISNTLYDTIRGVNNGLFSNATNAETSLPNSLTAFNSNGFSLGSAADTNTNGSTYVAWQWDAGSSTVTNTNGTISSQVRANPTAGVSVVTYTGTGANATVGHGLGVAPKMVIFKGRNAATDWGVYHASLGATGAMFLDLTSAFTTASGYFNNTAPTSSVMTVGGGVSWCNNTSSSTHVAYCFAEISGFSKAFSYTGNGSTDGVFVYLGFRPKYIMIKNSSAVTDWIVYDTSRSPYNVVDTALNPNTSAADGVTSAYNIDLVSNGFKCRSANASLNSNGATFVGIAFAENPFQNSNAR